MKTAVIYARYSSTNQTEQSIEGQVHVCEDYAKRNDILIVDSYIDRAISGTTDNRESFQKMLKDSNNKKWDYVLVYKLDRFARNRFDSAINTMTLSKNGVRVISETKQFVAENLPDTAYVELNPFENSAVVIIHFFCLLQHYYLNPLDMQP